MKYINNKAEDVKIAYIGGGSRGWAWGLMSDLASCDDISGDVYLYDIDFEAAQHNEEIGNMFGISKERVRQIERQAMDRLQQLGAGVGLEDFLE